MKVSPIEKNGNRFLVSLQTKNGEAERFALGLGWFRRKILLYASDDVDRTATTRSKTGLEKIAERLEDLTIPDDACDIERSIRTKRIESLGLTPDTTKALGEMAIQLRKDISPELNQDPGAEQSVTSEVQADASQDLLGTMLEDYIQQQL